jgi:energy-coupling factor transporter ATP-binding protein EcfA2
MNKVDNIADLHNEVLELLLEYKKENNSDLTFQLRPNDSSSNKRYLNKGWWFMGSRNSISFSFLRTKYLDDSYGFFGFAVIQGFIILKCEFLLDEFYEFGNELGNEFSNRVGEFEYYNDEGFLFEMNKFNFKTDFKTIIQVIDKFLNKYQFAEYRPIPQEEFRKNLNYILSKRKELQLKKEQDILYHSSIKERVFITDLSIKNYYEVKETSISQLPKTASWVFLTGENGAGKSLVLQALAIGLYGNKEDNIVPENKNIVIEVTYQSQGNTVYKNNTKQLRKLKPLPYLACFGPIRLDVQNEGSENQNSKRSTATYGLFGNYDALFKNIETELKFAFYENKGKYDVLVKMLKSVVPSLERVVFDKENRAIQYFEKSKDNSTYKAVSFSELATGIKSIIAMVGDIYLRFSTLMQKNNKTDKYLSPEELYGIVIIDELDLHLHPTWQKRFPTLFSKVFPNIQFIASTHSAIPILGAPKGSVLLKVNRNAEKGIVVERLEHLEAQLENLTPNLILTSEIFGLQDIFPVTHQTDKRIRTENTMEELKENDEMLDALKSYMGTDKEDELLKLFAE